MFCTKLGTFKKKLTRKFGVSGNGVAFFFIKRQQKKRGCIKTFTPRNPDYTTLYRPGDFGEVQPQKGEFLRSFLFFIYHRNFSHKGAGTIHFSRRPEFVFHTLPFLVYRNVNFRNKLKNEECTSLSFALLLTYIFFFIWNFQLERLFFHLSFIISCFTRLDTTKKTFFRN